MEAVPSLTDRSTTTAKLFAALAKAQAKIGSASKDRTNPHFGSKYATLASVVDACRPALAENGLCVIQRPSADGQKVTVETILAHESGEWISAKLAVSALKAEPQSIGSALTYARRYGLAAMTGVAPDEDDDGAAASQWSGGSRRSHSPYSQHTPPPSAARVPTKDELLKEIEALDDVTATGPMAKRLNDFRSKLAPTDVAELRTAFGTKKAALEQATNAH